MTQNAEQTESAAPVLKFANQNQLINYIFQQVQEGVTGEHVASELRKRDNRAEVEKFFETGPGGRRLTVNEKLENIKGLCAQIDSDYRKAKETGPLEFSMWRLNMEVAGLVGDIAAALVQLELTNPRDVRDTYKILSMLLDPKLANDTILNDAISTVYEASGDQAQFEAFKARLTELYPNPLDDEEEDKDDDDED